LVLDHYGCGFAKQSQAMLVPGYQSGVKSTSVGEDAFFSRFNALGVGDGVGGWQGQGKTLVLIHVDLYHALPGEYRLHSDQPGLSWVMS
jgi:hypothetical protein